MMADENLNHVEIVRDPIQHPVRGRQNPGAPHVPHREDPDAHATRLAEQSVGARARTMQCRQSMGVSVDRLMVLEFGFLSVNQRDVLIEAFGVSVVEELQARSDGEGQTKYRLLVQFPDQDSMVAFNNEIEHWRRDNRAQTALTCAKRRDLFSALDSVRQIEPRDREGPRLRAEGTPNTAAFYVDIDLWYDGSDAGYRETDQQIRRVLQGHQCGLTYDLFRTPSLLLGRALITRQCLQDLLSLDLIATVDLPPKPRPEDRFDLWHCPPPAVHVYSLPEQAPMAAVVDSGVLSGHPLLNNNVVLEEVDFRSGDSTETDLNGHGTAVAGTVVYGDIVSAISEGRWVPRVRICSAKVLRHDPDTNDAVFPDDRRPEALVDEAIRYFHEHRGCRVFNVSIGNRDAVYEGGRQLAWAETLDRLVRELDIVIVISAGNVSEPCIPGGWTRDEMMENARNQLLLPEHRLVDPGTASLCLVVGSIARRDDASVQAHAAMPRLSMGPKDSPSVFTRCGFGVAGAIKPDLVDYGGNYALQQWPGNRPRWHKTDTCLCEPVLRLDADADRFLRGANGTSYAAPHVTHICSLVEHALRSQMGFTPSANLIRAMVVNSATIPSASREWASGAADPNDHRSLVRTSEYVSRMLGYGKASSSICWSTSNRITLYAETELPVGDFHVYTLRIPPEFFRGRFAKRIAISLAYNPPTRLSRYAYIANRLWFEVYRGLTPDQLENFRRRRNRDDEGDLPSAPRESTAAFKPGRDAVQNSTVQLRTWEKGPMGGNDLLRVPDGWADAILTILVAGKERFPHAEQAEPQSYALVVTLACDSDDIDLYNVIRQRVRIRQRVAVVDPASS